MAEAVITIIERALTLVEQERPEAYAGMTAQLDGLHLCLEFESPLTLLARDGLLRPCAAALRPDIHLVSTRATLLTLLAGDMTLTQALRGGAIELRGPLTALSRALAATEYFLGALLRLKSATQLRAALEGSK